MQGDQRWRPCRRQNRSSLKNGPRLAGRANVGSSAWSPELSTWQQSVSHGLRWTKQSGDTEANRCCWGNLTPFWPIATSPCRWGRGGSGRWRSLPCHHLPRVRHLAYTMSCGPEQPRKGSKQHASHCTGDKQVQKGEGTAQCPSAGELAMALRMQTARPAQGGVVLSWTDLLATCQQVMKSLTSKFSTSSLKP
jgi:hypothetical protein